MMEAPKEEGKPNFLMGGEDGFEDIEEKDEFPSNMSSGGLTKQLSDAALIDKRRRLRYVKLHSKIFHWQMKLKVVRVFGKRARKEKIIYARDSRERNTSDHMFALNAEKHLGEPHSVDSSSMFAKMCARNDDDEDFFIFANERQKWFNQLPSTVELVLLSHEAKIIFPVSFWTSNALDTKSKGRKSSKNNLSLKYRETSRIICSRVKLKYLISSNKPETL